MSEQVMNAQDAEAMVKALPTFCEYCGPHCFGGAEHNARVEDGARWTDDEPHHIADCKGTVPMSLKEQIRADVSNGFICGSWTIRMQSDGEYVYRCDRPDGHTGDHSDSVLLTNWREGRPEPRMAQSAAPEPDWKARCGQMEAAINWACGCGDAFKKPTNGGPFWWRAPLRMKAGMRYDGRVQRYTYQEATCNERG